MTSARPPKKSETLEIRLPHASKLAFMERCRAAGLTASEVVRGLIETETEAAPRVRRTMKTWQALVAAVAGIVIGAAAAPSIAQALPGSRVAFDQMDANHDGVVSFSEFRAR
ncbi:EF-hand domain-containing protein [Brevundimonas sp.]|uniref:EF-hand domain-containing protein n=1 Tax=Brevundimonas sp. TaxID=1871086 RepID=UPI002628BEF3|nr:EF-hand domain-containing protein [Brevundimonas sp.]